ncbi:hypothetical protein BJ170DRAFT_702499 [Xylariales sp. AK1849]|nr:hypothetical protein BJ170DRAFT_702499 [Xylariales sp. AK1849]
MQLEFASQARVGSCAVLSHTWKIYKEVISPDFQNLEFARRKKGFGKNAMTCSLVKKRGLHAELSEAIKLMFRWYNEQAVCFVYLSDLTPLTFDLEQRLAPANVEFYDEDEDFGFTKRTTAGDVPLTTGIDAEFLLNSNHIKSVLVGLMISWAANRATTLPGDASYRLLEIFSINMPMIRGEGSHALIRLQEEVCKQTSDLTLFASRSAPSTRNSRSPTEAYEMTMSTCYKRPAGG